MSADSQSVASMQDPFDPIARASPDSGTGSLNESSHPSGEEKTTTSSSIDVMDSILSRLSNRHSDRSSGFKRQSDLIKDSLRANPTVQTAVQKSQSRKLSMTVPARIKSTWNYKDRPSVIGMKYDPGTSSPRGGSGPDNNNSATDAHHPANSSLNNNNSSVDERAPTFMVPPDVLDQSSSRRSSATSSPSPSPRRRVTPERRFNFTLERRMSSSSVRSEPTSAGSPLPSRPSSQPSSLTTLEADWGADQEWILLFDNLLKSPAFSTSSCRRECQCERHGKRITCFPVLTLHHASRLLISGGPLKSHSVDRDSLFFKKKKKLI